MFGILFFLKYGKARVALIENCSFVLKVYYFFCSSGECWSGPNSEFYKTATASDKCFGSDYKKCGTNDRHCVGENFVNMVYRIGKAILSYHISSTAPIV